MSQNYKQLTDDVSVSGQLMLEELPTIAAAGFRTIINNRPDHEATDQPVSDDMAAAAAGAGLAYYHVPVSPNGVTARDVAQFEAIISDCEKPVLAFCRTGNRSSVLVSMAREAENLKPLSFFEVMGSTLAAVIGVQSKVNKQRDFTRGTVVQFVIAGLVFTILFVGAMMGVVRLVLGG